MGPVLFSLHPEPRLALATILNAKEGAFLTMCATVCSTFVQTNLGTSRRSWATPLGDISLKSVQEGNLLASRILG